ncbi:MAG: LysR family transcriptional regulator [Myxococcota bacterium]
MNWDDLRYILALSRHGTLLTASRALKVSPTTMSRRLRTLEEDQGAVLFERLKHGAVLTAAGERVLQAAIAVEEVTDDLDAAINGLDSKLAGSVRVASTETLIRLWMPDFAVFVEDYPNIELELTASMSLANLTQREADVAVRLAIDPPDHLVGRKHAKPFHAVYGAPSLVVRMGAATPYAEYPWVALESFRTWMDDNVPEAAIAMRLTSLPALTWAAESGIGLALLPCMIGDANPSLVRVGDYVAAVGVHLWVLTHPKLRASPRIRAFRDFMRQLIDRDRDLIEGRRPRSPT